MVKGSSKKTTYTYHVDTDNTVRVGVGGDGHSGENGDGKGLCLALFGVMSPQCSVQMIFLESCTLQTCMVL